MVFPFKLMRVNGDSMRPTLNAGELVVVRKGVYARRAPRRTEVVAARPAACGGRLVVKRLAGVPHDELALAGRCLRLQADQFFLLGDRLEDSTDSRSFGPVTAQELLGPVARGVRPWKILEAQENRGG